MKPLRFCGCANPFDIQGLAAGVKAADRNPFDELVIVVDIEH